MQTHYDTLEITETASPEVIRGAYRFLCQKWHPDKNSGQRTTAEAMTRALNIAYAVLSDPERRRTYDSMLRSSRSSAYSTQTQQASSGSPPINPARRDEHKLKTTGASLARKTVLWLAILIGVAIFNDFRKNFIERPLTQAALHEVIPGDTAMPTNAPLENASGAYTDHTATSDINPAFPTEYPASDADLWNKVRNLKQMNGWQAAIDYLLQAVRTKRLNALGILRPPYTRVNITSGFYR